MRRLLAFLLLVFGLAAEAQQMIYGRIGQVTNISMFNVACVDAVNGNDNLAAMGTLNAFQTCDAAALAASNYVLNTGNWCDIYVSSGLYVPTNNLAQNQVNWHFAGPSCVVSNFANYTYGLSTNAIFTDQFGPVPMTFNVYGWPTLIANSGTNYYGGLNSHSLPFGLGVTNATATVIRLTNLNTTASFQIWDAQGWDYNSALGIEYGIIGLFACSNVVLRCHSVENCSFTNIVILTNGGHTVIYGSSSTEQCVQHGQGNVDEEIDYAGPTTETCINSEYAYLGSPLSYPTYDRVVVHNLQGTIYHLQSTNVLSSYQIDNWNPLPPVTEPYAGNFSGNKVSLKVGNLIFTNVGTQANPSAVVLGGGVNLSATFGSIFSTNEYFQVASGTNLAGGQSFVSANVGQFLGASATNVWNNCSFASGTTNLVDSLQSLGEPDIAVNATGVTNTGVRPGIAWVTATAATFYISNSVGQCIKTNTSLTGTFPIQLFPNACITAASGLAGSLTFP